jgi:alkylation response protein AidB-like acyl-CoA dehydrogenase
VAQGQTTRFGTYLHRVDGGYVVDGTKAFCTSAGGAQWAVLLVNTAGPGGARHSVGPAGELLLAACDLSDPTVCFDPSWWNPIGMRSTVSHVARFDHTFIPDANLIGYPGQYFEEGWQTCFIPHYAASFLGAAEAVLDYALTYVQSQKKTGDPYIQQHVAQASIDVETSYLWLRHVASLWERGQYEQAKLAGIRARFLVENLAEDAVKRCIRACGAQALNRPSPLERIYRDLSFYVRHDNADHILATVGRALLGLEHDPSFFKP